MKIEYYLKDDSVFITIEGNIDAITSVDLSLKFQEIIDNLVFKNVVLDLNGVKALNSSGIGKILKFYKYIDSIGGDFKIVNVNQKLLNLFKDINLDKIISIS